MNRDVDSATLARSVGARAAAYVPLLVSVAYFAGAKVGFILTAQPQPVSTMWPPNAILLAALLLTRPRSWPGVLLAVLPAHLAVELHTGVPLSMVLCWFVSNCTEALIGAAGIRHFVREPMRFDSFRQVAVFGVFGAFLAPLLSSFLDVAFVMLNAWGEGSFWQIWRTRLFSNSLAMLTLVPTIVTWSIAIRERRAVSWTRAVEAVLLATSLVVICVIAFTRRAGAPSTVPVLLYAPLPVLLWAAVRFGPAGTSASLLTFSLVSVWGALYGEGPFAGPVSGDQVLPLQLFLIVISLPLLSLAAVIRERERAKDLVRQNEDRLNLALSAAQVGTWDWDVANDRATVSERTREILDLASLEPTPVRKVFIELVEEDDRAAVAAAMTRSLESAQPYNAEYRIRRPDGSIRWVLSSGKAFHDQSGTPVRMIGVNADITERKRADAVLRDEALLRESEARLRELADAMPQIMFTARPDGRIDYFNRKWYEFTGHADDLTNESSWLEALHPDDRPGCTETWLANVRSGRPHECEGRFLCATTGVYRWHLVRALPVRDASGSIMHWYGTATDLHDRKRAEQELRESEATLRGLRADLEQRVEERTAALSTANDSLRAQIQERERAEQALRSSEERFAKAFRASPDAIAIARYPDGEIIEINQRWAAMFGFARAEALGQTAAGLGIYVRPEDGEHLRHLIESQGYVTELEMELCGRSGSVLRGVVASETVDMSGDLCVISIIRDITERRRAEQEVEDQRRQLAHLGRVATLGELSGALAHELNQPLAAILANARAAHRMLLEDQVDGTELRAILADIVADDRRAGEVIRRVRALIRKGASEPQRLAVNDVMAEALGLARSDLTRRSVVVETRLATRLPDVCADRVQLQQVLLNLIMNACDAMADNPYGDRRLTITTAVDHRSAVRISVADCGHGIADSAERVFEPFFTTKEHGLGLGLAICRSIAEAHGARLWAVNNPGRGATFHLAFPQEPVGGRWMPPAGTSVGPGAA